MHKNQQMQQLFIQFINYVHVLTHHATKHNTPIHSIYRMLLNWESLRRH
jgi:hypothetical protein